MSKLEEIKAALANGYDSCPDLAKEDVSLLLAIVEAVIAVRSDSGLKRAIRQVHFIGLTQPRGSYRSACEDLANALKRLGDTAEASNAPDLTPLTPAMIADIEALPLLAEGGVLLHNTQNNTSWMRCGSDVSVFMFETMVRYELIIQATPQFAHDQVSYVHLYIISDAGREALERLEAV